jgi:hypothetical protein
MANATIPLFIAAPFPFWVLLFNRLPNDDELVKSHKATNFVIAPWHYPGGSSTYWIPAFAGMTLNGLFAIPSMMLRKLPRYEFLNLN